MHIVKQSECIDVENLDEKLESSDRVHQTRHGSLLPPTIRGLIIGPSNCGKTNVMLSLLLHPKGLRFANVYLYSKSLYQPKYEYLQQVLSPIEGLGFHPYSNNGEIIQPSDAKRNSIFIFDDVICENQNIIRSYFSMGRHKDIDCFYLAQTYSRVPKQLVRDNANFIVIFKQDEVNLQHVYSDHVSPDVKFCQFQEMCRSCWDDRYGFLAIDKDKELKDGRYKKGLHSIIYP